MKKTDNDNMGEVLIRDKTEDGIILTESEKRIIKNMNILYYDDIDDMSDKEYKLSDEEKKEIKRMLKRDLYGVSILFFFKTLLPSDDQYIYPLDPNDKELTSRKKFEIFLGNHLRTKYIFVLLKLFVDDLKYCDKKHRTDPYIYAHARLLALNEKYFCLNLDYFIEGGSKVKEEHSALLEDAVLNIYKTIASNITAKKGSTIQYPIDSTTKKVFNLGMSQDELTIKSLENGTLVAGAVNNARAADLKNGIEARTFYSIFFKDAQIKEVKEVWNKLTAFDKRVFTAVSNLYLWGNRIISPREVAIIATRTKQPNKRQVQKVLGSIEKMMSIIVTYDNTEEGAIYDYRIKKKKFNLILAKIYETEPIRINGALVKNPILLLELPELFSIALERNQIITLDPKLLDSPVNKTDAAMGLDDYLIQEIKRMKNGSRKNRKMLIETICKNAGINISKEAGEAGRKRKQRAIKDIIIMLDYWKSKECDYFITGYKMSEDKKSVLIIFNNADKK